MMGNSGWAQHRLLIVILFGCLVGACCLLFFGRAFVRAWQMIFDDKRTTSTPLRNGDIDMRLGLASYRHAYGRIIREVGTLMIFAVCVNAPYDVHGTEGVETRHVALAGTA